jgi:hypothetical protein
MGNRVARTDSSGGNYAGPGEVQSYTAKGQLYFAVSPTAEVGTYDYVWHWYDGSGLRVLSATKPGARPAPMGAPVTQDSTTRTFYVYDGADVALVLVTFPPTSVQSASEGWGSCPMIYPAAFVLSPAARGRRAMQVDSAPSRRIAARSKPPDATRRRTVLDDNPIRRAAASTLPLDARKAASNAPSRAARRQGPVPNSS